MKLFALLLALAVPAPLAAQDAKGWYPTVRESRESNVIRRRSFPVDITLDAKAKYLYCMIAPGADWALDSKEEQVEEQYLKVVAWALHLDALALHDKDEGTPKDDGKLSDKPEERFTERSGGVVGFCGTLKSPAPRVDLDRIDAGWRSVCRYPVEASRPGRYANAERTGGPLFPPKQVVVESLKALAKSPHAKTATKALDLMEEIKSRDKLFVKTISEVLLDPKAPLGARERAAEILASVHTHDLSGVTLAAIWGDKSNPESLRRAALRGYSLVMSFGDSRSKKASPDRIRDRLRKYLPALTMVIKAETVERANGKDTLTPLGEDARCVAQQYSLRWLCYVKRYEANWYEEMKKDDAAGVDFCTPDGKPKR